MLIQEIIRIKRDGGRLEKAHLARLASGLVDGSVSDAQGAAFAMAVLLKGMSAEERVAMTLAMRDSGTVLRWDVPGPVVDKHSTGGVGDNVSLVLMPALAACGAFVPGIAGRGLGHTGGTLDKLDSIPGYQSQPEVEQFQQVVAEVGCAIIGQTDDIAPADRRLYAIRDITATVESVDLITASILSKKLATGLDALMLDIKCGSGAFMADLEHAHGLSRALVEVANATGCNTAALITDMSEPLASAAGNALEVLNAVHFLTGTHIDNRLWDVVVTLGGELMELAGLAAGPGEGVARIGEAFRSGQAAERFGKMVAHLGGPVDLIENVHLYLPAAPIVREVRPSSAGIVQSIDTRALGMAIVELGGGRVAAGSTIDPSVGLSDIAGVGRWVGPDEPICLVHADSDTAAAKAAQAVLAAVTVGPGAAAEAEEIIEFLPR